MKKKTMLTKMHIAPSTVRYDAVAARDSNEVGQILAGTRKRNGYSLVAFSELLRHYGVDVSDKGISKWEKGASQLEKAKQRAKCSLDAFTERRNGASCICLAILFVILGIGINL